MRTEAPTWDFNNCLDQNPVEVYIEVNPEEIKVKEEDDPLKLDEDNLRIDEEMTLDHGIHHMGTDTGKKKTIYM